MAASVMSFFAVPRAWLKLLRALPIGPWPAAYRLVAFAWWLEPWTATLASIGLVLMLSDVILVPLYYR